KGGPHAGLVGRGEPADGIHGLRFAASPSNQAANHKWPRTHQPRTQAANPGRLHLPQHRSPLAAGVRFARRMRRGVDDRQNLPQPGGFCSLAGMNHLESIYRKQVALPLEIRPRRANNPTTTAITMRQSWAFLSRNAPSAMMGAWSSSKSFQRPG